MTVLTLLLLALLLAVGGPFLLLTVGIPLLLLYWPNFFAGMFFMNWVKSAGPGDYDSLAGVQSRGRNFWLSGRAGRVGVWHLLPEALKEKYQETDHMEKSLSEEAYPIVLYNHGNSRDRTSSHRILLYNLLTRNSFHVVAFDYRGFGDSEGEPTEEGLVEDARLVYDYVKTLVGRNQLFLWGHSMGTGVSVRLVKEICLEGRDPPSGLVLESGFNTLHDVVINHPFAFPFRFLPRALAERLIVDRFRAYGLSMTSDLHMAHLSVVPILQLHAADDLIIPVKLARKLKEAAEKVGCRLEYVEFEAGRQLGHKMICTAEELPERLINFIKSCSKL